MSFVIKYIMIYYSITLAVVLQLVWNIHHVSTFTSTTSSVYGRRKAIVPLLNNNNIQVLFSSTKNNVEDASTSSTSNISNKEEEALLSDIDKEVLKSLIKENADLTSNENMKRILERDEKADQSKAPKPQTPSSKFASKTFQKIDSPSDKEVWNSFVTKTSSFFESAVLFLGNRVIRDVKLVGAIGVFALDRALKDAARVLPAVSSFVNEGGEESVFVKTLKMLPLTRSNYTVGRSSSIVLLDGVRSRKSVKEELTTSEDEVRQVWSSIKQMLSSTTTTTIPIPQEASKPFLKTIVSSSTSKERKAERFRKASASKQSQAQLNIPSPMDVVDATYEWSRELEYEEVGYKTKPVRQLLSSTTSTVKQFLSSASAKQSIAAAIPTPDEDTLLLQPTSTNANTSKKEVLAADITTLITSIQTCLNTPSETWLSQPIMQQTSNNNLAEESLREVVTSFVMLKQYLEQLKEPLQNYEEEDFLMVYPPDKIYNGILNICMLAQLSVGKASALYLEELLLLPLDSLLFSAAASIEQEALVVPARSYDSLNSLNANTRTEQDKKKKSIPFYMQEEDEIIPTVYMESAVVDIVDVDLIAPSSSSQTSPITNSYDVSMNTETTQQSSFQVEVITTQEGEEIKFKNARSIPNTNTQETPEKDNIFILLSLRSLDVLFYIVEKVFIEGAPRVSSIVDRVSGTVRNLQLNGEGCEGWKVLERFDDAANRY